MSSEVVRKRIKLIRDPIWDRTPKQTEDSSGNRGTNVETLYEPKHNQHLFISKSKVENITLESSHYHPLDYFYAITQLNPYYATTLYLHYNKKVLTCSCHNGIYDNLCSLLLCQDCCHLLNYPCKYHNNNCNNINLNIKNQIEFDKHIRMEVNNLINLFTWYCNSGLDLTLCEIICDPFIIRDVTPNPTNSNEYIINLNINGIKLLPTIINNKRNTDNRIQFKIGFFDAYSTVLNLIDYSPLLLLTIDPITNTCSNIPSQFILSVHSNRKMPSRPKLIGVLFTSIDPSTNNNNNDTNNYNSMIKQRFLNMKKEQEITTELTYKTQENKVEQLTLKTTSNKTIATPIRSVQCKHNQCNDLIEYVTHCRYKCLSLLCSICYWRCTYCNSNYHYIDDLYIDIKQYQLIQSNVNFDSLLLFPDGKMYGINTRDSAIIKTTIKQYSLEQCKQILESQFKEEYEIGIGNITVSLKCPFSQIRMVNPGRSVHCIHPQCFDIIKFIDYNIEQNNYNQTSWSCPICNKLASSCFLYLDLFMLSILNNIMNSTIEKVEVTPQLNYKTIQYSFTQSTNIIDLTDECDDDIVTKNNSNNQNQNNNMFRHQTKEKITTICKTDNDLYEKYFRKIQQDLSTLTTLLNQPKSSNQLNLLNIYNQCIIAVGKHINKLVLDYQQLSKSNLWDYVMKKVNMSDGSNIWQHYYEIISNRHQHALNLNSDIFRINLNKLADMFHQTQKYIINAILFLNKNDLQASINDLTKISGIQYPSLGTQESTLNSQLELDRIRRELDRKSQENNLLLNQVNQLKERLTCVICYDKDIDTILFPCNHQCLCQLCASKLFECPVCRHFIQRKQVIFRR